MQTLAVIGTGIAGMGAAYFLRGRYDITFYEKNNYPGGHTNTLTIDERGAPVYIDSAFMVYNEITYPNLVRLFKELEVETKPTDMSFSVQHLPTGLEYCGTGLNGLFGQRKNLLSFKYCSMLFEMNRFNKESLEVLENEDYFHYSVRDYAREKKYSADFLNKFLVPITSAVWSTPADLMLEFPIVTLVRFFKNHGFLGLRGHYQWRTVVEGSQRYREKILRAINGKMLVNNPAYSVFNRGGKVVVQDIQGNEKVYDKIILACHADEALKILGDATNREKELLSPFKYQLNRACLHIDESVMPKTRRVWSSWNYRMGKGYPSTIYWMNNLQHVSKHRNYFISINDDNEIDPTKILWKTDYTHPLFNVEAISAQKQLPELNKNGVRYFCGSYFKYGFHEDALTSGLDAARAIAGEKIWN